MALERHPVPTWIVVGAGTGGTSATIGRYVRYRRVTTQLCVVDPQNSVFADYFATGDVGLACDRPSRIEGIGRQRVEPSFIREVIDRMERIDDASSLAAMQLATDRLGRSVGGSTGTNLCGAFRLIAEMLARGQTGSVVHADLRRWRAVPPQLLRRGVAGITRVRPGSGSRGAGVFPVDGHPQGQRLTPASSSTAGRSPLSSSATRPSTSAPISTSNELNHNHSRITMIEASAPYVLL